MIFEILMHGEHCADHVTLGGGLPFVHQHSPFLSDPCGDALGSELVGDRTGLFMAVRADDFRIAGHVALQDWRIDSPGTGGSMPDSKDNMNASGVN